MNGNKMHKLYIAGLGLFFAAGCAVPAPPAELEATPSVLRYRLGTDPNTGAPIFGGAHQFELPDPGKAEAIDFANRASALHPQLGGEYLRYAPQYTSGSTTWDVFPSNWWPMSKNGTAWRWQPGADQDLGNTADRDRVSPIEKYDLLAHPGDPRFVSAVSHCGYSDFLENGDACAYVDRPSVTVAGPATKWELENQGTYQVFHPDDWWGHCNGWASYATAEPLGYPQRDVSVRYDGVSITECNTKETDCVLFKMADIEALMTELYFSDRATFAGRRCDTRPEDMEYDAFGRPQELACRDLNPGTLHIAMVGLLGRGANHLVTGDQNARPAFVIDHHYDEEVWNFPVVGFDILDQEDLDGPTAAFLVGSENFYPFNPSATSFVRIRAEYRIVSDSVSPSQMLLRADLRSVPDQIVELNYVLELDGNDNILGGEWIESPAFFGPDNRVFHPDFAWIPISHRGPNEFSDDTGGNDDNPFVSYPVVRQILLCSNDPLTCASGLGAPVPELNLCEGNCGLGPIQAGTVTCFCDAACEQAGDCCGGYSSSCKI